MNCYFKLVSLSRVPSRCISILPDARSGKIPFFSLLILALSVGFLASCSDSGSDSGSQYENFYVVNAGQATFTTSDTTSNQSDDSNGESYSVTLTNVQGNCIRFEDRPGTGVTAIPLASLTALFQTGKTFQYDPPNATLRFHVNQGTDDETFYNAVVRINGVSVSSDDETRLDMNVTLLKAISNNVNASGEEKSSIWDAQGKNLSSLPEQGQDVCLVVAGNLTDPWGEEPEWLYWQNAGSGTFETTESGYTLVLKDLPPSLVKFSAEPQRLVKTTNVVDLTWNWGTGHPFDLSPPNALVRFQREDDNDFVNMIVSITQAEYDPGSEEIRLDIVPLSQAGSTTPAVFDSSNQSTTLPESGKDFTLFIDDEYECESTETLNNYSKAYKNIKWDKNVKGSTEAAILIWNLTPFPTSGDVEDNVGAQFNESCSCEDADDWECGSVAPACPLRFILQDLDTDDLIVNNCGRFSYSAVSKNGEWIDGAGNRILYPGEMLWFSMVSTGSGAGNTRINFEDMELTSMGPIGGDGTTVQGTVWVSLNYDAHDGGDFDPTKGKYFSVLNNIEGVQESILYWHIADVYGGSWHNFFEEFKTIYKVLKDAKAFGSCDEYEAEIAAIGDDLLEIIGDALSDYQLVIVVALTVQDSCFDSDGRNTCYPICTSSSNVTKILTGPSLAFSNESSILPSLNFGTQGSDPFHISSWNLPHYSLERRPASILGGR